MRRPGAGGGSGRQPRGRPGAQAKTQRTAQTHEQADSPITVVPYSHDIDPPHDLRRVVDSVSAMNASLTGAPLSRSGTQARAGGRPGSGANAQKKPQRRPPSAGDAFSYAFGNYFGQNIGMGLGLGSAEAAALGEGFGGSQGTHDR